MKTGYEIKMIETKVDVILDFFMIEKHNSTMKKIRVTFLYSNILEIK